MVAAVAAATITSSTTTTPTVRPIETRSLTQAGPTSACAATRHQVFDKYQALAREAASSGDRIMAEAYWQYADHYYRMIQASGGFAQRNNQGWGDGGEEGQAAQQQQGPRAASRSRPTATGTARASAAGRSGGRREDQDEASPASAGVAFLQNGRNAQANGNDPAADEQPEVPEFTPATGRVGGSAGQCRVFFALSGASN